MNIILVDGNAREHFLPFAFTRPIGAFRIGVFTLAEKWARFAEANVSFRTTALLAPLFPERLEAVNVFIDARIIAHPDLANEVSTLKEGQRLVKDGQWVASCVAGDTIDHTSLTDVEAKSDVEVLERNWHLFQKNGWAMEQDVAWLRSKNSSANVPDGVTLIGENIFIEEGATILPSIINSTTGPIYLASGSKVSEGAMIRGGLALHTGSEIKMGAKIYGPTTIGPHSKIGGEVSNSIVFGYSNKGHDGFMGNSVIGEWCNLGADTNTSNLKNNYSEVSVWNYATSDFEKSGDLFCGLLMGDHAKSSINTMFNTGTVCGVFANVFDGGFPPKHIAGFSWGGASGTTSFRLDKALEMAERVMARRKVELSKEHQDLYSELHRQLT